MQAYSLGLHDEREFTAVLSGSWGSGDRGACEERSNGENREDLHAGRYKVS